MDYYEKIALLDEGDFFSFLFRLGAEPRWVTSAGKKAIQMIGACHHGDNHSALFDPDTMKVNCFSECGGGMLFHTFIKQALDLSNPQDAKDYIEEWIDNQELDLSNRIARRTDFEYKERSYAPTIIEPVEGMNPEALAELKERFICDLQTLDRLDWHRTDGINPEILALYDVTYYPAGKNGSDGTIILPHHNRVGNIVGLYERSFRPLRKKVKEDFPEIEYKELLRYPRAKYVPLLRDEKYRDIEGRKTSWSFPNSQNLYGLHLAEKGIKENEVAIIFEGGKSVMLAYQYGFPYAVATHTFGAHLNHISMLIECGAKEIILAFDKQYEQEDGQAWELYQRKTQDLATRVGKFCKISRLIDKHDWLEFKDSPIDKGEEIFRKLLAEKEVLTPQINESGEIIKRPLQDERLDGQIELTLDQLAEQNKTKRSDVTQMNIGLKTLKMSI